MLIYCDILLVYSCLLLPSPLSQLLIFFGCWQHVFELGSVITSRVDSKNSIMFEFRLWLRSGLPASHANRFLCWRVLLTVPDYWKLMPRLWIMCKIGKRKKSCSVSPSSGYIHTAGESGPNPTFWPICDTYLMFLWLPEQHNSSPGHIHKCPKLDMFFQCFSKRPQPSFSLYVICRGSNSASTNTSAQKQRQQPLLYSSKF